MSYSFELATPIGRVRDEIDDISSSDRYGVANPAGGVEGTDYFLSDERIASRLSTVADEAATDINRERLAAASCLDTLATNQIYQIKVGAVLGESFDGKKVEEGIRQHAKELRERVALSESKAATPSTTFADPSPGAVAKTAYLTP